MNADGVEANDVLDVLDEPDYDDTRKAYKRIGRRTVIVYYSEEEDRILVDAVSATSARLPSKVPRPRRRTRRNG